MYDEHSSRTTSIQEDLDMLQNWTVDMQMRFHPAKCRTIHLWKHTPNTIYTLPTDNGTLHEISQTAEEKNLGVTMDDKLIFSRHIQIQVNKANSAVGLIRQTFKYLHKKSFMYLISVLILNMLQLYGPPKYRNTKKASAMKSHQTDPRNILLGIHRQAINLFPY